MLEGKKTYIGGIGLILTGAGNFCSQYYNGNPISWETNLALILNGLALCGIGAKIERKK